MSNLTVIALALSSSLFTVSCEERNRLPVAAPVPVVQEFEATLEECLSRYQGHPVVLLVNSMWSPAQVLVNKQLTSPEVAEACLRYNAVVVLADLTQRHEDLAKLLKQHGMSGVPYLAVYSADRSRPPFVGQTVFSAAGMAKVIDTGLGTPAQ